MKIDLTEHIKHWESNKPPPENEPGKFDQLMDFKFRNNKREDLIVTGKIHWDRKISSYYFQYMQLNSDTRELVASIVIFPAVFCLMLKHALKVECGISVIKGVYDVDEIPGSVPVNANTTMQ